MKNILIGIGVGVTVTGLAVVLLNVLTTSPCIDGGEIINPPHVPSPYTTLTEPEARALAEASCIKGGEALGGVSYNPTSKTWWFDANLNATQPGCSPACVVFEETRTTEINWRCTGLVPPKEEPVEVPDPGNNDTKPTQSLLGKTWVLVDATRADGTLFVPKRKGVFTLTFDTTGSVDIGTDCNSMGGGYNASDSSLVFSNLISTLMYCDGSEEGVFSELLSAVSSYEYTDSGELIIRNSSQSVRLRFN
jgi:heat shock protein HslJ